MPSDSNDSSKLILTAVSAAVAGAAVSAALMTWLNQNRKSSDDNHHVGIKSNNERRTSYLIEDSNTSRSDLTLLFPHNHEEKMRRQIATRHAVEEDNSMPRRSVTVKVPATSANMGPGCK